MTATVQPEDQFKPFDPISDSFDGSSRSNSSTSKSSFKNTDDLNVSGLHSSPARVSVPPSSLSSPGNVGIAKGDVALKEDQQVFRGVRGIAARPSSISRLSLIDTKWLERCQVFGEMETEVKPGAGNQENVPVVRKEEVDRIIGNKDKNVLKDLERGEGLKGHSPDKNVHCPVPKQSQQQTQEKVTDRQEEAIGTSQMSLANPEDENKPRKYSACAEKKGKKRQREGENIDGEMSEEGGVKKRRRNAKKESSDVKLSPDQSGGKRRRAKKEDGETKEEKDTKLPKKVKFVPVGT